LWFSSVKLARRSARSGRLLARVLGARRVPTLRRLARGRPAAAGRRAARAGGPAGQWLDRPNRSQGSGQRTRKPTTRRGLSHHPTPHGTIGRRRHREIAALSHEAAEHGASSSARNQRALVPSPADAPAAHRIVAKSWARSARRGHAPPGSRLHQPEALRELGRVGIGDAEEQPPPRAAERDIQELAGLPVVLE
jgi:hypothetical protein